MAALTQVPVQVYDVRGDTVTLPPSTVTANYDPGVNNLAEVGSMWVNYLTNAAFMLTSTAGSAATWTNITQGGAAGPIDTVHTDSGDVTGVGGAISIVGYDLITVDGLGDTATIIMDANPLFHSLSTTTTIISGQGITATTGNIISTAGNVNATVGSMSAGTTVTAGTGITATTGDIVASTGNLTSTLGSVSASTTVTAGTGVTSITGNITAVAGDLVASNVANGFVFSNGVKILSGSGDPNGVVTAPLGSLYLNHTGSGVADRAYINTNAGTVWTAISTVA